jgi:selenocysteine lyase/cysteine desulfurase
MAQRDASTGGMDRREFARALSIVGAAAWLPVTAKAWPRATPLGPAPAAPDERFWTSVRERFVMPPDLAVLNAANLCPSSGPVLESLYANTKDMDHDPSFDNRVKMGEGKEATRRLLADFLHVAATDIVITRNTSEANNTVSSGLDLKSGDEVVIFEDNHPSNHAAWMEKSKRFGFAVKVVKQVNPHPGAEYYVDAFRKELTARTKLIAFTHLTSTVGDLFPAKELCRMAREHDVLSLVDGAQTFGLLDIDLSDMQPDFYTGSAHKWPCGPKEVGVLYVSKAAQPKLWPNIVSVGGGHEGISKTIERFGQRDEPAIIAFGEALKLQTGIGRKAIQDRSNELGQALIEGLRKIDGVKVWTHPNPQLSSAIVSFQPASLDPRKLSAALYRQDRIACATRGGPTSDRGGLRMSPHFYNSHLEIDRAVAAIARYVKGGISTAA